MTAKENKTSINEHLARSLAKFNCPFFSSNERKQKIQKHVRLSRR
jgi:predicted PP-loop superfamily ATPase